LNLSIGPSYHLPVLLRNLRQAIPSNSNDGVKELRLKNLQSLATAKEWRPADFVREVGKSPSYWSDMLRGAKGFGEAVAREIEEKVGLPRFWLDQDHERGDAVPARQGGLGPALEDIARAIAKLPKLERRQLGALLPLLAEEPETRKATCQAIMRWLEPASGYDYTYSWDEAATLVAAELGSKKITAGELIEWIDRARAKPVQAVPMAGRKTGTEK
jgi:hypothetical protein